MATPGRSVRSFQTLAVSITSPGTAERVTAYYVPDGFKVTVTNRRDSTGNFYVAETQAKAQSGARKVLTPGQSVDYVVDNTARLWFDADSASDVMEIVVGDEVSGSVPA